MAMSVGGIDQTIMPPDASKKNDLARLHELERLRELMEHSSSPKLLISPDEDPVVLPEDLFHLLKDVIGALTQGLPVRVDAKRTTQVSTSQAADILGVSRATMVRFLEEGRLKFHQPGKHRRIELAEVLEFKRQTTRERHEAVADLQEITSVLFDE